MTKDKGVFYGRLIAISIVAFGLFTIYMNNFSTAMETAVETNKRNFAQIDFPENTTNFYEHFLNKFWRSSLLVIVSYDKTSLSESEIQEFYNKKMNEFGWIEMEKID